MTDHVAEAVDAHLAHWADDLGSDRRAYTNHVVRMLKLCDALHRHFGGADADKPTSRELFVIAGVFHDLGIWTAHTLDYLEPSAELARRWLADNDRSELADDVSRMIVDHHKLTGAGDIGDPVEIFRRADFIDASLGLRRFGLPMAEYRSIAKQYPNAGFHKRLAQFLGKQVITHPTNPAPMFKW